MADASTVTSSPSMTRHAEHPELTVMRSTSLMTTAI